MNDQVLMIARSTMLATHDDRQNEKTMKSRLPGLPPLVIVWRICESCSLHCKFCGYSRELVRPRVTADARQVVAFGRVLQDVQTWANRSVLLSWLGGEPLAWNELPALSRIYHRQFGLRLGVTTNGLPLALPHVRDSLLADYEQVTISIPRPWAAWLAWAGPVPHQPAHYGALRTAAHCVRRRRSAQEW
jgi:MoaA/NifB/PqqE/SkfB family radical SAM enzyme